MIGCGNYMKQRNTRLRKDKDTKTTSSPEEVRPNEIQRIGSRGGHGAN